ncbi:Ras family protein [Dictyocaulus viviparus]|uniref:small monomeric GTPase n=1 Tax=Dictyocaulus viviparus TaxID=29172 RepID=A0A0D8X8J0_DICVI|nr:Ras family protein [Dictyocaulus viviparus]
MTTLCETESAPLLRLRVSRGGLKHARLPTGYNEMIGDGPGSSIEEIPTFIRGSSPRSLDSSGAGSNTSGRVTSYSQHIDAWRSRRQDRELPSYDSELPEDSLSKEFNRVSFLRRSVCALRRSIGRRSRKKNTNDPAPHAYNSSRPWSIGESTKEPASSDVRPSRSNEKCEILPCGPVCVYSGFGRTFERINPGEEIAIAVFGKRGVGKTSLLDHATLLCEGQHGIAPLGLTERMRLGGKQNHMEYRFAHMTSMTVQTSKQLFVIDLIDAEFEDDHSVTHTSYMRAVDAVILLYSCSDSASLLTAMSIHRQLATVAESRKPCVLLANVIHGALQRYVTREMGEKTARNIRAVYVEADLLVQEGSVSMAIEYLCRAVVTARKSTDVKDICSIM